MDPHEIDAVIANIDISNEIARRREDLATEELMARRSAAACSPCCDVWPMFIGHFGWMRDPEGNRMMPYLSQQGSMWRINHCPSCGASVRAVIIPAENADVHPPI